jgi:glycosyltransferase involved in cell wall biosynthesis
MNRSLFSIVVCCFNEEKTIIHNIKSILKIEYPKHLYELIIIDDGSTDQTLNKIKEWIKKNNIDINLKLFKINHSGLSIARNTGFYLSKNDYCLFCDADGSVDRNILKAYDERIKNNINYIYTGKVNNFNKSNKISNFIFNFHNEPSLFLAKNKLIGANMLLNKKMIKDEAPFFNFFTARGDETAMFMNLQKKYNIDKAIYVENAIVNNETADNFLEWFKKIFIEGLNSKILITFFNKGSFRNILIFILKLNSILLIGILFSLIFVKIEEVIFISLFVFLIRIYARKNYLLRGFFNILKINFYLSFFFFFASILGIIASDLGFVKAMIYGLNMNNNKSKATFIDKIYE